MTPDWAMRVEAMQLFSAFALFGLIWTVQLVVYPAFRHVPPDRFTSAHRAHTGRIAWVVIPLLGMEGAATAAWLWYERPLSPYQTGALACVAVAWLSTFLLQVPLHHRLGRGFDAAAIERLIGSNWIRTLAWSGKTVILLLAGWL